MPYQKLDKDHLTQALRRLGKLAVAECIDLELSLYKIKPASRSEVEALFARFFPHDVLSEQAKDIIDTTLAELT